MVVTHLPLPKPKVAVYGTLRAGGHNEDVMKEAGGTLLGDYWTPIDFTMHDLHAYPAVTLEERQSIHLEVYEVLAMGPIDRLEGWPDLYQRKLIPTPFGQAWIYYMDDDELYNTRHVACGDWLKHIEERGR